MRKVLDAAEVARGHAQQRLETVGANKVSTAIALVAGVAEHFVLNPRTASLAESDATRVARLRRFARQLVPELVGHDVVISLTDAADRIEELAAERAARDAGPEPNERRSGK